VAEPEDASTPGGNQGPSNAKGPTPRYGAYGPVPTGDLTPVERIRHNRIKAGMPPETDYTQWRREQAGMDVSGEYVSRLVPLAEMLDEPEPSWLVRRTLPDVGVAQLVGPSYTGKSYLLIDLALTIANGLGSWMTLPVTRRGPVVYILMEGTHDFGPRIRAWLDGHPGATTDDVWVLRRQAVNLRDKASVERLIDDVTALGIEPVLVIVDTQAKATVGTEENSSKEMGEVLALCEGFTERLKTCMLLSHHTGKDVSRGSRGSSAQFANIETELLVPRKGEIEAKKVKGGDEHGPYCFEFAHPPSGPLDDVQTWSYVRPAEVTSVLARAASESLARRTEVLDAVAAAGSDGLSKRALASVVTGRTEGLNRLVDELAEEGLVEVVRRGNAHVIRRLS
jgi:hypothetical protein